MHYRLYRSAKGKGTRLENRDIYSVVPVCLFRVPCCFVSAFCFAVGSCNSIAVEASSACPEQHGTQ